MAVRSVRNQYCGINAHLHSLWQASGGWSKFHTGYILNLSYALKPLLLPIGYTIAVEPSLQIRRLDRPATAEYSESDLTIYDLDPGRPLKPLIASPAGAVGELTFRLRKLCSCPQLRKNLSGYQNLRGSGEARRTRRLD